MGERVLIERRFRGPPESANGGYACGMVASFIGGEAAEVTLRVPPPLERPLDVSRLDEGKVELRDGATLVAEGRPVRGPEIDSPDPVAPDEAEQASRLYPGFNEHAFPMCFVCGPDRVEGDGLRIFPGRVEGHELLACTWIPDASVGDGRGAVRPEFVWSVLDCPSGIAASFLLGMDAIPVLARLSGILIQPLEVGDRHVVLGWPIGREGRKRQSGTAIFTEDGDLRALSLALWIDLKD